MSGTLKKQALVGGHAIGAVVREMFRAGLESDLEQFRAAYIAKIDEKISDFQRKVMANMVIRSGADLSMESKVSVEFMVDIDQLRKECGL